MSEAEEIKLFDAPDLQALQRNWPRIALRLGVIALVPFFVTMLAKSLDLYNTITNLPLPLDFLARGPFAYEAKAIFFVVAVLLGLAFLVPKRTTQLVMAICVGGVLWTGHVYIQLQWARLFATSFHFRTDAMPGPLAWIWATLLMMTGVSFLLVENLLDTRQQQIDRKLGDDTKALFNVGWQSLGAFLGIGAAFAAALVGAYLLLRTALDGVALPFRLNPVFVLLGMGICLAVLVAIAARRQSPLAAGAAPPVVVTVPVQAPRPAPASAAASVASAATSAQAPQGWWRAMRVPERVAFVAAAIAVASLFIPWTFRVALFGTSQGDSPGFTTLSGIVVGIAAIATLATYPGRTRNTWRRFGPLVLWAAPIPTFVVAVLRAQGSGPYLAPGIFLGFAMAMTALVATSIAAFGKRVAA